jgi:hypothetical protein
MKITSTTSSSLYEQGIGGLGGVGIEKFTG